MPFLFFDLGNVLVLFDHHQAARNLARVATCSESRVVQTLFHSDLQQRYETGLVSDDQYAAEINVALGSNVSTPLLLEAISDIFQPNWPILKILEQVRASGVPMGILSNTCQAHWKWLVQQDWPMLGGWFEQHVLSYEVRSMKPSPAIYEACEKVSGRSGRDIFFTDDRIENVAAAAERGWIAHRFENVRDLSMAIERWIHSGGES